MEAVTSQTKSLNELVYLPPFAAFLLHEKLDDFIRTQFRYAQELNVPLLRFFLDMPEEQRMQISRQTSAEFLKYLAENRADEQIEQSMKQWKNNALPVVDRNAIVAEDITLINHLRKKAMLDFVPGFTSDALQVIELVKEIDLFNLKSTTTATNLFIDLFKHRLEENAHFIQKVVETVPGAVYVFDVDEFKGVYSNNKLPDIIGYKQSDLNQMGEGTISSLIHPDDQERLRGQLRLVREAQNDETAVIKYRIRKEDAAYKWLANYESVFRRKEDGSVAQTIGITLDIDKEQCAVEQVHEREQRLLEAQNIAQLGDYYWDFEGNASTGSAKTFELLEVETNQFADFMSRLHPADQEKVKAAIDEAIVNGRFDCEYRIVGKKATRNIWARGLVEYRDGKAIGMKGTVMDVTQHNQLLQKLAEADARHKQAEALAHIGTYAWNFLTDEVEWSDEMYRLYELDKDTRLTYEIILKNVHPDDREMLDKQIRESIATKQSYDVYYRIVTPGGKTKILHSRGGVALDDQQKPQRIVGSDQDVTEKQTLIRRLQKTELLYKQVEEIADMGNWSRDMLSGKIEWTDQLYRIYGLEPQAEEITTERFLSFVHPDDREEIEQGVTDLDKNDKQDYTFRIIAKDGTQKWLRSIAQTIRNESGELVYIIGTEQNVTEKQELINRLRESQRLYKQAQSLARMGSWAYDLKTEEVTWSDELFAIYERPKERQPTTQEWMSYVSAEDRENMYAHMREAVAQKKPMDVVHRINLPNGKIKIIHRRGEVIYDVNGEAIKLVGTTQDITEQSATQAELKESQTFIRKITDATPSIIAVYNVNTGVCSFISEGLEKLLGYHTSEVMDKGIAFFMNIVHPDDVEPMMEKNRKAIEEVSGNPQKKDLVAEFTYRMKHRNGSYRWLHTYGTVFDYDEEGNVQQVLNISLDVTEQKEAIETIREQEYFIQQIADASPTILYLFDVPSQSIAYINREAFFVLGYLPEEIIEESANITAALYHPDDVQLLPARKESAKNFQQVDSMIQYECRMKHKDGEYRWLLVREIVFKSDDRGAITQIIGAALDITRRKDMERTILQNAHQLEQSNASLEEFAYVASHDLKEPLRKISTFGDRLVASQLERLSDDGKIYLKKIVDASQRMQNMISDLLSISMISGNRQFEKWSLQKILEETLQTLEYKIEQQKAIIRYDSLPEAHVIPSQFRQLFQNLIANSLKFVREGVQPLITVECTVATEEETRPYQLTNASSYLKLSFSDNGIGFEPEQAQKIFAIFHRLHGRSEYEGSGIGLAICKKIVEHHGGIIFATGRPDHGAVFTLIIPA